MRRPLFLVLALALASPVGTAHGARIVSHDVEVSLEPELSSLRAIDRVEVDFEGDSETPWNLLLHSGLEIESVRIGNLELQHQALRRWQPRDFWERPDFAALGVFANARQHRVSPPQGGWPGKVEVLVEYAGAIYDSLRAPDVAYSRGFETTSGLIGERGAYLSYESFWVPWSGDGRFDFELTTNLPAPWQSMSQGARTEHFERDGRNLSVWVSEGGQELIYLIAGPYVVREREHGKVALYTYTYENTPEELCETYLDAARRYIDRYGEEFGDYAFAKWAMVENWWQTGFGMPGFTLLGDRVIRLPFIVDTSYGHEILHCWWGNGVYVDYDSGNWCEGLTAYGADYTYKREQSPLAARDYRRSTLVGYLDFASSGAKDFPLSEFRERTDYGTQAIGYGKSLMVFHMLERRLGAEKFREGLRLLYDRFLFRPAGWSDLADAFSEVAGEDLHAWFSQWIERIGAVDLSFGEVVLSAEGYRVEVRQKTPHFETAVEVVWDEGGEEHSRIVDLHGESAFVVIPSSADRVRIDPGYDLFRRLYREEIPPSLSQVLGADSTTVVIGDACPDELADALRGVANTWARNQDMRIVDERNFDRVAHGGRGLFLLGPGTKASRALEEASRVFGDEPRELHGRHLDAGWSLVAAVRDPDDAEIGWVLVLPGSVEDCEPLGRKLPHYSNYSWLLFDADENVGKGSWTVLSSPLHRELAKGSGR